MNSKLVVIGQGYVGLPLSRSAGRAGLSVVGLDRSANVVSALNAGRTHIDDVTDADLQNMVQNGYRASTDPSEMADADVIVICVPTPLGDGGRPDLRAVEDASRDIAGVLTPGTTVVLESTTYPGTTEELVLPVLCGSGLKLDTDFWLAFSPERIDPGNPRFGLENTPKIIGGVTIASTARAAEFYECFIEEVVRVRSAKEAETSKLLENTYRHVNIALMNEMAKFCHELEIDIWDVIEAAKTKPFGFQAFYPGPGVGGHCIPIDPNYLSYEVERSLGYPFRFVELAQEINNSMPRYVAERIQDQLNNAGKPLRDSKILLLGVTYKADIRDQRESPARPLAGILRSKGAEVQFHDPRVAVWRDGEVDTAVIDDLDDAVRHCDIAVLLQNHREYDVEGLAASAQAFFDTRGVVRHPSASRL